MIQILLLDDERGMREMLTAVLQKAGYKVDPRSSLGAALDTLEAGRYDLVVTDLALPDGSGMELLAKVQSTDPSVQVLMMTAFATTEQAVEAMRKGAYDYVQKPFRNHEFLAIVEKALEKRSLLSENRALRARLAGGLERFSIVGQSPAMTSVFDLVERVANKRSNVLIAGESGTGKELVARALHDRSERAKLPFLVVNCGAMPEHLMESELFGYEKGAFTGANQKKEGLFKAAQGGSLFLDEVGELPLGLQVKLLRVLQERRVRPVGGTHEDDIDVRVIAATNRNLEDEVQMGRFRQDLYYRLNVIRVAMPALRERPEDIPLLADHFLRKHGDLGVRFEPEAMRWIMRQSFPGNVRELENLIERATALCDDVVRVQDLEGNSLPIAVQSVSGAQYDESMGTLDDWLSGLERQALLSALEAEAGSQTAAAKRLGITFRSIRYRLRKYGLISGELGLDGEPE